MVVLQANLQAPGTIPNDVVLKQVGKVKMKNGLRSEEEGMARSVCGRILYSTDIFHKSILNSMLCIDNIKIEAMQLRKENEQNLVRYRHYTYNLIGKEVTLEPAGL